MFRVVIREIALKNIQKCLLCVVELESAWICDEVRREVASGFCG